MVVLSLSLLILRYNRCSCWVCIVMCAPSASPAYIVGCRWRIVGLLVIIDFRLVMAGDCSDNWLWLRIKVAYKRGYFVTTQGFLHSIIHSVVLCQPSFLLSLRRFVCCWWLYPYILLVVETRQGKVLLLLMLILRLFLM